MDKKRFIILCILIVGVIFTSCGKNNESQTDLKPPIEDNTVEDSTKETDDIIVEENHIPIIYEIKDEDNNVLFTSSWQNPDLSLVTKGDAFENIKTYYSDVYAKQKEYWDFEIRDLASEQKKKLEDSGGQFVKYFVDEQYNITLNSDELVCVVRNIKQFTGGTNEAFSYECETFIKDSGALLLLTDFFDDANYRQTILSYIDEAIDKNTDVEYFENVKQEAENGFESIEFYLTNEALNIVYPTYTLAPYSEGPQIFEIRLNDITDIIKDGYLS